MLESGMAMPHLAWSVVKAALKAATNFSAAYSLLKEPQIHTLSRSQLVSWMVKPP